MAFEMRLKSDGRAYAVCDQHGNMNPVATLNVMQCKKDVKRPKKRARRIKLLKLIATCPICNLSKEWEMENTIFTIRKE